MEPVVLAVLVGIAAYIVVVALIPKSVLSQMTPYTRNMLQRLEEEAAGGMAMPDHASVMRDQMQSTLLARVFITLPGAKAAYPKLIKAGLGESIDKFFLICLIMFLLFVYMLKGNGFLGVLLAVAASYFFAWRYIIYRVRKRNDAFLQSFPDALDMIVRSVRSGYPLNAAVRMVAENMQPPVSIEFKQVADETAYGSTLIDSLQRLSYRIDEPDIRFFVVVLTVQQEVGGNLAEVLNNLSTIIRKRKHLRLKIKAMTSEGRATTWVLASLPVAVFFAINLTSPGYLDPFFTTGYGRFLFALAVGIVLVGLAIVRKLVKMEV
jgi:tight adherence protein B